MGANYFKSGLGITVGGPQKKEVLEERHVDHKSQSENVSTTSGIKIPSTKVLEYPRNVGKKRFNRIHVSTEGSFCKKKYPGVSK